MRSISAGEEFAVALIDRPDRPSRLAPRPSGRRRVRSIATSGWRGRSFSLASLTR
jgi:hypothetical protein